MPTSNETADDPVPLFTRAPTLPGLLLVWSAGAPTCRAFPFRAAGVSLDIGRDERSGISIPEDRLASRRHADVAFDSASSTLRVRDVGSKHGTFVDGARIEGGQPFSVALDADTRVVLRIGDSIFLAELDTTRVANGASPSLLSPDGTSVVGPAMAGVHALVIDAAARDRSLVIHGESGTGKERVAKLFHDSGPRARGPFVAVNCARFERERADLELFGATRGGYTGADRYRAGAFERADHGTLFLDEVAELSLDVQAKLLRVLEDRVVEPLGGDPKSVDVAICCATNRDLRAMAKDGAFRDDLFIRLAQREVELPPLRKRPEEIPFLIELFRARVRGAPACKSRFVEACLLHEWPLNIRDLDITVERAAATAIMRGTSVDIPPDFRFGGTTRPTVSSAPSADTRSVPPSEADAKATNPDVRALLTKRERTRLAIRGELIKHDGDVDKVLEVMGDMASRTTIYDEKKRMAEEAEAQEKK